MGKNQRSGNQKISASMPDVIKFVTSTELFEEDGWGSFMIPLNDEPTITKLEVNGIDITSKVSIFPRDQYLLGNVTDVVVSSGSIILFK